MSKKLLDDFYELRDAKKGKRRIKKLLEKEERDLASYLSGWLDFSKKAKYVYPTQGLLITPHDYLDYQSFQSLPQEKLVKTLRLRRFFLEMFNHPLRIKHLEMVNKENFVAPKIINSRSFEYAEKNGLSVSVRDLGACVIGSKAPRTGRTLRYAEGPFVKLGKQARTLFVGSASPDVWNSAAAISTMAASHCLAAVPRNGLTSDVKRQADLAKEVFGWLKKIADEVLKDRDDKKIVYNFWKRNVMGTLGATAEKALRRAEILYKAGVRSFRVYSPEPGTGPVEAVESLRKQFGNRIEIFAGQIVDVDQAKKVQEAGADGLFIGIGGGGRCITGVRSGSVIDWPELLWKMRGEISIPVIVEGGASDNVAVTLLLGASGIGVSRVVSGGTIESPGGALFCSDNNGRLFKPYGGEASARTKFLDGKVMPFNVPSFVEGETTKAEMSYVKHVLPTLTYNLHLVIEDAILAMVFRNVKNLEELQKIDPSPLRISSAMDTVQRESH